MNFIYPVYLSGPALNDQRLTFPDFPEATASGGTLEEALRISQNCLDEAVASYIEKGLEFPEPSPLPKPTKNLAAFPVTLSAQMTLKATLYAVMVESATSKVELAKRLDINEKEVRRIMNPRHGTKLSTMERALEALGKKVVVDVEDIDSRI